MVSWVSGTVYALLGRNGAGKSSLVRVLLGMQPAAAGSSRLFGLDSWAKRAKILARAGYVPETPDAPPRATTEELVRFCGRVETTWDDAACRERLARAHIPLRQQFGSLSKGQQRLVSLALALGSRPELLVLDDPTLGLDIVASRTLFEEVITELAERGVTVFLTTHDLSGVERIATHRFILIGESVERRIVEIESGETHGTFESRISPWTMRWLSDGSIAVPDRLDDGSRVLRILAIDGSERLRIEFPDDHALPLGFETRPGLLALAARRVADPERCDEDQRLLAVDLATGETRLVAKGLAPVWSRTHMPPGSKGARTFDDCSGRVFRFDENLETRETILD